MRPRTLLFFALAATATLFAAQAGQAMVLASTDFSNGGQLALAQVNSRCGGENRSPALSWTGAPAGTKSYALTLFDPDAGGGRGFWHWIVFDIPATAASLPSGAGLTAGAVQAENDFGDAGFGGACPPPGSGLHHYQFTLYALGMPTIPFGSNVKAGELVPYLRSHALATAVLTGTYQR